MVDCKNCKNYGNRCIPNVNGECNALVDAKVENVDHPKHYVKEGRKECIVEMEEKFGSLAVYWFSVLSAYKYRYRAGDKEGNSAEQDEAKALWYDAKADEMQEKYNDQFICRAIDEKFRRHENAPNDFHTGKEVTEQFLERSANHDK